MFGKKRPLVFETTMDGDIAIIKIGGRLDSSNIEGCTDKFQEVVDNQSKKVIIDLCDLHYISSIWLSEFMGFSRYVDKHDGSLVIINMDKKIFQIFDVLGFTDNFIIVDDMEKAKLEVAKA